MPGTVLGAGEKLMGKKDVVPTLIERLAGVINNHTTVTKTTKMCSI